MAGSRTLKLSILADVDDLKKKLDTGSKEVEGFGGKLEKFGKVAAAAFAAAAAAAAAYAGKLAIEGVKAAIEDEAAQNRLANALKNVTAATDQQIASVEEQITKLALANGVADDQLRPAFQRLAVATGSLTKSSDLLSLALDVSAATGKDVEAVANALGKAYEGNTGALGRLGLGISAAEIKTLGLEGTMQQLAKTFGGAATVQANTLEGQIARLQVAFDEAKESVGAALLPTLQRLLDYFVNTVIPNFIKFKDAAIAPVTAAIERNKESLTLLYNFIKQYVIPVLIDGLGDALKFLGRVAGGILDVIGAVVKGIKAAVEFAINGINVLIKAYNAIPFLPNVNTISAPTVSSAPSVSKPSTASVPVPQVPATTATSTPKISNSAASSPSASVAKVVTPLNSAGVGNFNVGSFRQAEERGNTVNITVNGAVDPVGTARQIATILNTEASTAGTFSNLGVSRFATRAE
jgi:hypothetical protein